MRPRFIALLLTLLFTAASVNAAGGYSYAKTYRVTITNITNNILFTPFIVATHTNRIKLFALGEASSDELAALAEGGDTMPLSDLLKDSGQVHAIEGSAAPLGPGESVEVEIKSNRHFRRLSLAAMLLPTNDTFVSLNSVALPRGYYGKTVYHAKAYDAGSEPNDELCANIPGPCAGQGGSPDEDGEGYVHPSPGIHGEADLSVAEYDWRDPVAKVVVERVR